MLDLHISILSYIGARGESNAIFGQGSGPIWHSNVGCSGTEERLLDCSTGAVGGHTCSHSDDAGVTCNTSICYTYLLMPLNRVYGNLEIRTPLSYVLT